jgi:ABC-2 type transport system permease protein
MSDGKNMGDKKGDEPSKSGRPAWWLMFLRELTDLWYWGRALYLIVLYSILLGIMAFVLASNSELDLIPPKEMVFLTLQVAMAVGLFIGLIIGADSISGERERATLEGLLLAPASRRQIVTGKYLAAISPWPVALLVAIPFLFMLAQGDPVFGQALFWGGLLGSILAPAFTAFGLLVSVWSNSNKTSLFVSLTIYILFLLPTQFPGTAQTGTMGQLLKKVNPLEATNQFLEKILVNNRTLEEMSSWLIAPLFFAALVLVLLFLPCLRWPCSSLLHRRWPRRPTPRCKATSTRTTKCC